MSCVSQYMYLFNPGNIVRYLGICLFFQPEYHKEAEKIMHHHNLPLDYPEFVRAKVTAKNASDVSV